MGEVDQFDLIAAAAVAPLRPCGPLTAGLAAGFGEDGIAGVMALGQALALLSGASPAPWGAYWGEVRDGDEAVWVGIGAFKAPPDAQGVVEIPITPSRAWRVEASPRPWRGAGDLARQLGATAVLAHTAPGAPAQATPLERSGFSRDGQTDDPEEGTAWRWRLQL